MSSSKPTIIIAHGSWHSPEHFVLLETNLSASGYKTHTVWLPTMHYGRLSPPLQPGKVNLLDDVKALREAITHELSSSPDTDVVLLSHSSGTVPASSAIENLDKLTRSRNGFQNGVSAFLVISGLLIPAGITGLDFAGGQTPPTVTVTTIANPEDNTKQIEISNPVADPGPIALFYHDVPDTKAARYARLCTHQIWAVNKTVIPFAGWKVSDLSVFYLVCEEDRALPPGFQRLMIENADRERAKGDQSTESTTAHGGNELGKIQKDSLAGIEESQAILEGVKSGNASESAKRADAGATGGIESGKEASATAIQVTNIQSGHSPFLSRVEETATWVRRCCGDTV